MQVESEGHTADASTPIDAHIRAKLGAAQGIALVFLPGQMPSTVWKCARRVLVSVWVCIVYGRWLLVP